MRRRNPAHRRKARQDPGALGRPRGGTHRGRTLCVARASQRPASHRYGMSPRDGTDGAIVNALTIDVEDYFQVSAFAAHIPRSSWDSLPCRVERNIDHILLLLADAEVRATFFTLGWIGERY